MLKFENLYFFWGLIIWVAFIALLYIRELRIRKLKDIFADPKITNDYVIPLEKHNRSHWLWITGLLFAIFSLANPQMGTKREKVKVEVADIFIALDISKSMDVTDITPSRLERAKLLATQIVSNRRSDQIGLIYFAGNAYLQTPLTYDHEAINFFIKSARTDLAGTQGTAIGEAINLANKSVQDEHPKNLIIITDGEDHDEEAQEISLEASKRGWNIFTIGVGTEEGGFVPTYVNGAEQFKIDDEGRPIKSALNTTLLKAVASKNTGKAYVVSKGSEDIIADLNKRLDTSIKRVAEVKSFKEFESYFQYFLIVTIITIGISVFNLKFNTLKLKI